MKRIFLAILLVFLCVPAIADTEVVAVGQPASYGAPAYTCVGWPSSSCTPTGTPTSNGSWTAPADRTYTRQETASSSGTATDVIVYLSAVGTGFTIFGVLYHQNGANWDLIAYGSASSPTASQWNTITLSTGTPTITSGHVYRFGIAHSPSSGTTGVGREDTGGSGLYYATDSVESAPVDNPTWTTVADRDMAFILKIQN